MPVRIATCRDVEAWVGLRAQLWPATPVEEHRVEAASMLDSSPGESIIYLDEADTGLRGFAEATLRRDFVNGCETSPVAFLEGIFVRSEDRGRGVGGGLVEAVRSWAREQGCSELASDANLGNTASHAFHRALGFDETERVVFFRMEI